jgi:cytochrome P460
VRILLLTFFAVAAFCQDVQYTKDGEMALPKNYREWVFLSSGIGMTYASTAGGNPNFENVFVNPAAYQAFLKTGAWPDKTVLILEVRRSDSKISINKDGRVQTEVAAIEAHVKDSERGGWAFYGFGKADTAKLIPKTADCYSCHQQSGAVDSTFVQFYPTLIEASKKKGTYKETER